MKRILIWIPLALLLCTSAYANDSTTGTGNQLITICNDTNATANNALWDYCVGYVLGVGEGEEWGTLMGVLHYDNKKNYDEAQQMRAQILHYCVPDDATHEQFALVVAKYLKDHPAELNKPSHILVSLAFKDAWPCTK